MVRAAAEAAVVGAVAAAVTAAAAAAKAAKTAEQGGYVAQRWLQVCKDERKKKKKERKAAQKEQGALVKRKKKKKRGQQSTYSAGDTRLSITEIHDKLGGDGPGRGGYEICLYDGRQYRGYDGTRYRLCGFALKDPDGPVTEGNVHNEESLTFSTPEGTVTMADHIYKQFGVWPKKNQMVLQAVLATRSTAVWYSADGTPRLEALPSKFGDFSMMLCNQTGSML
jgi:hypothetical protein